MNDWNPINQDINRKINKWNPKISLKNILKNVHISQEVSHLFVRNENHKWKYFKSQKEKNIRKLYNSEILFKSTAGDESGDLFSLMRNY